MSVFYSPTRGLLVWARGAVYRNRCGRRFGHFPSEDMYRTCTRCRCPLL